MFMARQSPMLNNSFMQIAADKVKRAVAAANLSDAAFARLIKESPQNVSNWWKRGAIPLRHLSKIAAALNVSALQLMPKELAEIVRAQMTYQMSPTPAAYHIQEPHAPMPGLLKLWNALDADIKSSFLKLMLATIRTEPGAPQFDLAAILTGDLFGAGMEREQDFYLEIEKWQKRHRVADQRKNNNQSESET